MKFRPRRILLPLQLFVYSIAVFGQGFTVESKVPPSVYNVGTFVSLEGRFSIALPQNGHGFQPLSFDSPNGRVTGDSYIWTMKEARFTAGYVDATQVLAQPTSAKALFDNLRDDLLAKASSAEGKLISEKNTFLNEHPGREMKFEFSDGVFINRIYLVGRRMYRVTAILKGEQLSSEAAVLRVFDSFRILTDVEVRDALQRKIAEATPSPLPQDPVPSRPRSDAEDEGLKGKVKSIINETENLSSIGHRKPTSTQYYNERGYLIKSESFDWKGNLFDITVYGYIDGERVSKHGYVRYEYNPPPMMVAAAPGQPKPVYDLRYSNKFKYRYDDKGRQIERQTYTSDGKIAWRCVFSFIENQKEKVCYSSEKLYSKSISIFDVKGNEIEETDIDPKDGSIKSKRSFAYEFDAKGNWIKKISSKWITKDSRSYYERATVYHRTITYY